MNGSLFDGLESEDYNSLYGEDWDDSIESLYDMGDSGESDYGGFESGEAQRSSYLQRLQAARRRRALARAQARAASQRRPLPITARPTQVSQTIQQTRAGIEKVDLENKVQTDVFSSVLRRQRDRIRGSEYALAASALMGEVKEQFPELFQGQFGTLVPFASLLLLKPDDNGKTGFERYLNDPRFLFPALALGLKLFRENRNMNQRVTISPATVELSLAAKESFPLTALDKNGQPFPSGKVTWASQTPSIATVDMLSGVVTAVAVGNALVEATVSLDGTSILKNRAVVRVVS
jgi:hypothetical protein